MQKTTNCYIYIYTRVFLSLFRQAKKRSHFAGLVTGSFMGIISLSFSAAFRYGGYLVTEDDITIKDMMT